MQQNPPSWFEPLARPAGLYRITQGVHVATGIATIPLLLAKLWVVYPQLFRRPVATGIASLLERLLLVPLVGGAIFLLFTGLANVNLWYPWSFNFRAAHYWIAWVTIGGLVVHVGAKFTATRRALRATASGLATVRAPDVVGRRQFLALVAGASGLLTLFTVGQTVWPLRKLALLAPRRPDTGPQGFPVNRSAAAAGVVDAAQDSGFRLVVEGDVRTPLELSVADLRALPQRRAKLPIACVEGWSASPTWTGVPVRDLLDLAGAPRGARVRVHSLQARLAYRSSDVDPAQADDLDTLLALEVDGEPLHLDHGAPVRLIGPNRPGVLQTKWVTRLVVS
jgi:DMSO/TMAO reductase YedYZ molybdopterin-dependent catalytic subunit